MNEVIIDGCNVAECIELYTKEGYAEHCHITNNCCKHSPNCYFKQLQRAKAENEKLKEKSKSIAKDYVDVFSDYQKCKQALEDIKIISDNDNLTVNKRRKQIADKINEVLDD